MQLKLTAILLLVGLMANAQTTDQDLLDEAKKIHEKVITIDTHNDINVKNFTQSRNYTMDLGTQVNLPKMEEGGLDVSWLIVYTGQDELNEEGYAAAYENAIQKFEAIHRLTEEIAPEEIELATTSSEVRDIVAKGKKVAMIGVENAYPLGEDLTRIKEFYERGARYMSLSHNGHSQFCDSNTGEEDKVWLHNGLSDLGKKAVIEMNRLGMMIDVSHPSKESIKQMFEVSKAPLIASHSSARALCNHSRNLDDELLELFKKHGGVVQTVAFSAYLNTEKSQAFVKTLEDFYRKKAAEKGYEVLTDEEVEALNESDREAYFDRFREMRKELENEVAQLKAETESVSVSDFVNHVDYLVEKIGIEHVGISSDFDGGGGIDGWDDASETLNVTIELVKRGYTEEEIAKLWGENLLRVMDEVEEVAQEMQKS